MVWLINNSALQPYRAVHLGSLFSCQVNPSMDVKGQLEADFWEKYRFLFPYFR